jgi:hypothetical protein
MALLSRKLMDLGKIPNIQFVGGKLGQDTGANDRVLDMTLSSGLTGGIRSAAAEDDLVIAIMATASTADRTFTIRDPSGVDYTLFGSEYYVVGGTYDTNLRIGYKFMGSSVDAYVRTGASTNLADAKATALYVFSGVDKTTPLDVAVVTSSATNGHLVNPPAITPASQGAFIVFVGAGAHAGGEHTYSASGLTNFMSIGGLNDTNDVQLGVGHYPNWTSGAVDPVAWTSTNSSTSSHSYACAAIALRPA